MMVNSTALTIHYPHVNVRLSLLMIRAIKVFFITHLNLRIVKTISCTQLQHKAEADNIYRSIIPIMPTIASIRLINMLDKWLEVKILNQKKKILK